MLALQAIALMFSTNLRCPGVNKMYLIYLATSDFRSSRSFPQISDVLLTAHMVYRYFDSLIIAYVATLQGTCSAVIAMIEEITVI